MQTEPEQWAVVQEVETVTGDFLTEPGVPFYRIVIDGYCADFDHRQAAENFVAAIQRAFEERERKLREALAPFAKYADGIGHFGGCNSIFEMEFASSVVGTRRLTQADFERARQALKEAPDGQ